jgi:hypothetical protein
MDLKKTLEKGHSKTQTNAIVSYIGINKNRFKALVKVYLDGPYRITQRAAWPLSYAVEAHPSLIIPHLKQIIDFLEQPGIHDAVKRNTMRLFQFIKIPKRYEGKILDLGFGYLQNRKEALAVRVFSMAVVARIIADQPDLQKELRILLEDELAYAKPAFLSRAKKVLKQLPER